MSRTCGRFSPQRAPGLESALDPRPRYRADRYRAARKELGPVWRAKLGNYYPAMALVAVSALVEPEALVEIQAVAYLGHDE